jgi:hypothetical protein
VEGWDIDRNKAELKADSDLFQGTIRYSFGMTEEKVGTLNR